MANPTGSIAQALVAAAKQESREIVAAAREGRRTLVDAQHDLSVLNAQLDAALAHLIAREKARAALRQQTTTRVVRYRLLLPRLPTGARHLAIGLSTIAVMAATFAAGWWVMQRPATPAGGSAAASAREPGAPSSPPVTEVARGGVASPVGTTAESTAATRDPLVSAAEEWLDAYYRQDRARMASLASPSVRVLDERTPEERLPQGLPDVRRSLSGTRVQVYGSTAVVSAQMTEVSGSTPETSAFIALMWTQQAGGWRLAEVRIVSAAAVSRAFRR